MLKSALYLCLLLCPAFAASAQDIIRFRLSKPYCLLNFLQACAGDRNASAGLSAFIRDQQLLKDTAFQAALSSFRAIPLEYSYIRDQFPEQRLRSRYGRISDMIVTAAVQSDDLVQFREKTIGLLPNTDHQALFRVLNQALPYYHRLVWQPYYHDLTAQLGVLKTYQARIGQLFAKLNHFYKAAWPGDVPFIVTIYPVPGRRVGTAATPHNNVLCVGVRTLETSYDDVAGVVLHEMCHGLYNEQPAAVQQDIERRFLSDTSRYGRIAYSYFDEGLATACGNGWAREAFNGKKDKSQWYNDRYIDGFAHGLYPLVRDYLGQEKQIDSAFIREAIRIFARRFPRAPYDYGLLLSHISLYSDAETPLERRALLDTLNRHYRVLGYHASSPILHATSIDMLQRTTGTQLIFVRQNVEENMAKLREIFPDLNAILKGRKNEAFVASFYDARGRAVVIIRTGGNGSIDKALTLLSRQKHLNPAQPYHSL